MSLARDVIRSLRRAIGAADNARNGTDRLKVMSDEIIAEVRTATDGSNAEKPAEAIVRLEQAKVKLDEAIIELDAGTAAAEEYIVEGLGGDGGLEPSPRESHPARPSPHPSSPTVDPFEPRPRPHPDMRMAAKLRSRVGIRKTVGRLVVGGVDIEGEIWSGKAGPGRNGPGLAAPWRQMETMTEHVEGHTAAIMRRDEVADAQLYITRTPCEDVPYGCQWQLEDALPRGSRLTMFIVDRRGGVRPRRFIGNGRGISDAAD